MSPVDAVVIAWIVAWAVLGAGRGLVEQSLSLTGLVAGALAGSRLAPSLLPGGRESVWLPLVALAGAAVGAALAQAALLLLAAPLRRRVQRGAARHVDRGGGLLLGAALGLAFAWLAAAVIVFQPAERTAGLRDQVRRSEILREALSVVPPDRVLGALARIDAFTLIPLPAAALPPPDPALAGGPVARRAQGSVVELRGRACGVIRQGTGWVAAPGLVATNAHVVAGQGDLQALIPGQGPSRDAQPVYVDAAADVALVRVDGMGAAPLPLGDAPRRPEAVVMLGYPGGGPLRAEAATAAPPRTVLAPDAYGDGVSPRSVVVTRGSLGPGSSGGPLLDAGGEVVGMIFGGSEDGGAGAAVPPGPIRRALAAPHAPRPPGPCS
jgi:S1-C subfamily serine protease